MTDEDEKNGGVGNRMRRSRKMKKERGDEEEE